MQNFADACEVAQEALWNNFWDDKKHYLSQHYPRQEEEKFIYWWQAHAADVLMDGYLRSKDPKYMKRLTRLFEGVWEENGKTFIHNWVDDMEWHVLALLRLWDITGDERCKTQAVSVWKDIQTAWNDYMGGGIAWQKQQLDYKNTPANAPAAMIAFRLYSRFHCEEDLVWGKKIMEWLCEHLVDPQTGFVWDGVNRLGDGKIDYDWEFTYCQGVFIQAALEYFAITGDEAYKNMAVRTYKETYRRLAEPNHGIFPYEGPDDCGLFRGIFFRYGRELLRVCPEMTEIREMIIDNGREIVQKGISSKGLIGGDWSCNTQEVIDLAQHLSGVMALEMAADICGK